MSNTCENKCAVLVNTCDSYEDVWNPFFILFKKYWPDNKYPIYFNTETKKYTFKGLNIKVINYPRKSQWGERLIHALKSIDTKYIVFLLDDFLLMDNVRNEVIEECIELMDKNEKISSFCFSPDTEDGEIDIDDGLSPLFLKRPDVCKYKLHCQAAIWRRELLISYIRGHESPWDWEILGSIRAERYKESFYILKPNEKPVFKYDFRKYGIIRGKWSIETPEMLNKEGIIVDYSKRGFYIKKEEKVYSTLEKLKPSYLIPVLKYVIHDKITRYKSLKK